MRRPGGQLQADDGRPARGTRPRDVLSRLAARMHRGRGRTRANFLRFPGCSCFSALLIIVIIVPGDEFEFGFLLIPKGRVFKLGLSGI